MELYTDIQQLFKALADVNRLRIIEVLSKECKSVNEIAKAAGLSQPLTSHHLKVLKNTGIARVENRASFAFYWITDDVIWKIISQSKDFIQNKTQVKANNLSDLQNNQTGEEFPYVRDDK